MTQPEVAILIVTHNSQAEIAACLIAAQRTRADVLVIDNASRDNSADIADGLGARVIRNAENVGFAAAVNQGVRATSAPCLLLLNPDAALEGNVDDLTNCCRDPQTGAAGGKLLSPEGVPQTGFNVRRFPTPWALSLECLMVNRLWPGNPVNWRYRCLGDQLDRAGEVDQPAGAFLMFRRDVWAQLGGFDEGYFPIWFEDVDFCKRLRDHGFRVWFRPEAVARHMGGHSISGLDLGSRTEYWYRSLLRYSIQHFGFSGRVITCLSVLVGSFLRPLFGGARYRGAEMLRVYCGVARLAFCSLWISKLEAGVILQVGRSR